MSKLLIKNAVMIENLDSDLSIRKDILLRDGVIQEISPIIDEIQDVKTLDVEGSFVSRGFIDMHTHITIPGLTNFQGFEMGIGIERCGVESGVSSILDAGTFGADNVQSAIDYSADKETNVYFLMNASKTGIQPLTPELEDLDKIDIDAAQAVYDNNKTRIVGIKARASDTASGKSGIKALIKAKELAMALSLPLVVHIGHAPPTIEEVLAVLGAGDVVTHSFHGKLSNAIVDENYQIKDEALSARERGVLFDIGHGSASFNYQVAKKLYEAGFLPDIISTDIYSSNADGPVISLTATVDKLITLNDSIQPWVNMITIKPDEAFKLSKKTGINTGDKADLVVFNLISNEATYYDSDKNPIPIGKQLTVKNIIKGNTLIGVNK